MDLIMSLDRTFQHARTVIAGVGPEQYDERTPCEEWTVRDLLGHMVGVVAGMGAATTGQAPAGGPEQYDDPAAQFADASRTAMAGWRSPDVMDRMIDGGGGPMPGRVLAAINLLDTATHTWDLATATGQPAILPEDVAAAAYEASQMIVSSDEMRAGRFGPEVAAPAGGNETDRLVAFLGRQP